MSMSTAYCVARQQWPAIHGQIAEGHRPVSTYVRYSPGAEFQMELAVADGLVAYRYSALFGRIASALSFSFRLPLMPEYREHDAAAHYTPKYENPTSIAGLFPCVISVDSSGCCEIRFR